MQELQGERDTQVKNFLKEFKNSITDLIRNGEEYNPNTWDKIKKIKDKLLSKDFQERTGWYAVKKYRLNDWFNTMNTYWENFEKEIDEDRLERTGKTKEDKRAEFREKVEQRARKKYPEFYGEEKKWEQALVKNLIDDYVEETLRELEQMKKSLQITLLNKAIIETEFVRDYPQYVTEMKEEMKFRNMDQPEAELKVAKKYRLPILSKLQGKSGGGRWTRMLKVAGAVTSSTAGIKTLPLYGKKKKKKEEDEE